MYQPLKLTQANSACVKGAYVPVQKTIILVCCFLTGFLPLQLRAQTKSKVDLTHFFYEYKVLGGTLNANEAGTFLFDLGSAAAPAADVLGIKLDIELSDEAVLPTSALDLDFVGSWLLDDVEVTQSITVNGSTRILHIELVRSENVAETGHGFVFAFPIVSAFNNVAASSLVTDLDGIVIVDNIELKMAMPTTFEQILPEQALQVCYPNPNTGTLFVLFEGADRLRATGMDGQIHEFALSDAGGISFADMIALQEGRYWVQLFRGTVLISQQWVERN